MIAFCGGRGWNRWLRTTIAFNGPRSCASRHTFNVRVSSPQAGPAITMLQVASGTAGGLIGHQPVTLYRLIAILQSATYPGRAMRSGGNLAPKFSRRYKMHTR
jgi:hypothetical protein